MQKKADYLIYDTTGIEANVSENNPKFFNNKLKEAKKLTKGNTGYNPYAGVYSLLPLESKTNPEIRQQYVNGHFCYAAKVAIVTDGLGIVRHISMFDHKFRKKHPETVTKRTDNPDMDKEIGDSVALSPILSDFFSAHKKFHFSTFIADSACDSYNNYSMLKNEFGFSRAIIPMNSRNSKSSNVFLMFRELRSVLSPARNFNSSEKVAEKTVLCVSSGCVLNLYRFLKQALALAFVIRLVQILTTANAFILIRINISVFIREFREKRSIGIL